MSKKKRKQFDNAGKPTKRGNTHGPSIDELRRFLHEFVFGCCDEQNDDSAKAEQLSPVLNLPVGASVYSFDDTRGVIVRHVIMMNWEGRAYYAISRNGETEYLPAYAGIYFLDPNDAWEANAAAIQQERSYCREMLRALSSMTVVDEDDEASS